MIRLRRKVRQLWQRRDLEIEIANRAPISIFNLSWHEAQGFDMFRVRDQGDAHPHPNEFASAIGS